MKLAAAGRARSSPTGPTAWAEVAPPPPWAVPGRAAPPGRIPRRDHPARVGGDRPGGGPQFRHREAGQQGAHRPVAHRGIRRAQEVLLALAVASGNGLRSQHGTIADHRPGWGHRVARRQVRQQVLQARPDTRAGMARDGRDAAERLLSHFVANDLGQDVTHRAGGLLRENRSRGASLGATIAATASAHGLTLVALRGAHPAGVPGPIIEPVPDPLRLARQLMAGFPFCTRDDSAPAGPASRDGACVWPPHLMAASSGPRGKRRVHAARWQIRQVGGHGIGQVRPAFGAQRGV
jgi:hypothetical protein